MSLKKIVFFAIITVSLFVINSFIHSIYDLWQKKELLVHAKQDLEKEKKENLKFKQKLSQVHKSQFVEEEARNKLFLTKPGEGVLLIPTDIFSASNSGNEKPVDTRANWQKWWGIFF